MIQKVEDEFNTVIFAIGRDACKAKISLEGEGVALNPKNGKVLHNELERTSVDNIYAIGDVLDGKPELTPVAIQAGKLLARRLAGTSEVTTDYVNVCTTVREDNWKLCYRQLNFPSTGVHPAGVRLLRPGGGGGHRAVRRGECRGVSSELLAARVDRGAQAGE